MVDDYLSDREQEEALRNWWRDNWRWIIGGVVLGLALLGGWRYWQVVPRPARRRPAKLYADFQSALQTRDVEQAARLLDDLASDHGGSPYTQQGRLLLAKNARRGRQAAMKPLPLLQAVADDSRTRSWPRSPGCAPRGC